MSMTQGGNETTADRGDVIHVLRAPAEPDLTAADGLAEQRGAVRCVTRSVARLSDRYGAFGGGFTVKGTSWSCPLPTTP
jgi:hypothetical protein